MASVTSRIRIAFEIRVERDHCDRLLKAFRSTRRRRRRHTAARTAKGGSSPAAARHRRCETIGDGCKLKYVLMISGGFSEGWWGVGGGGGVGGDRPSIILGPSDHRFAVSKLLTLSDVLKYTLKTDIMYTCLLSASPLNLKA